MEALNCSKCSTQDHHGHGNYFCRCEGRNIKLAKELRERGMNPWQKPNHMEIYAEDEEDFVEKTLTTPRPCTIWMKGNFDQKKIDEAAKRRGVYFIKTKIDNDGEGTICLPSLSSDRELDSKDLPTILQKKMFETQMPSQQQLEEESTEIKK